VTRTVPDSPLATTSLNNVVEFNYALNEDETRGLLAGVQYTRVDVDSPLAKVTRTPSAMSAAIISGTTTGSSPAGSAFNPSAARSF
jgi:hypothetical protein